MHGRWKRERLQAVRPSPSLLPSATHGVGVRLMVMVTIMPQKHFDYHQLLEGQPWTRTVSRCLFKQQCVEAYVAGYSISL